MKAARLYKSFFTQEVVQFLIQTVQKLVQEHGTITDKLNSRGKGIQIHFGHWNKRSRTNEIYQTADSRDSSFSEFWIKTRRIWKLIEYQVKLDFPEEWKRYEHRNGILKLPYLFGMWECLAINYHFLSQPHIDRNDLDRGVCVILPLEQFEGGEINIHDLGISFKATEKDIVILRSSVYLHSNNSIHSGSRSSIVLFSTNM